MFSSLLRQFISHKIVTMRRFSMLNSYRGSQFQSDHIKWLTHCSYEIQTDDEYHALTGQDLSLLGTK